MFYYNIFVLVKKQQQKHETLSKNVMRNFFLTVKVYLLQCERTLETFDYRYVVEYLQKYKTILT